MTTRLMMSACLVGQACRYDAKNGKSIVDLKLHKMLNTGEVVVCCPECVGGLPVPREPSEIEAGKTAADVWAGKAKVLTKDGKDVTQAFIDGAKEMLALCQKHNIKLAILKSSSPSCGVHEVYDGTHTGKKTTGRGVATELLINNGIQVFDETELQAAYKALENV